MSGDSDFIESSSNVFADLGLPDADVRLAKAKLARNISMRIQERKLPLREAIEILQINQPKVSAITRGRLADFSRDRLLTFVNRMGMDVEITVSANPEPSRPARMVVHGAGEALAAGGVSSQTERVRFD